MSLSILIPCRNEENSIEKTVKVLQSKINRFIKDYEIIIINDNSNDNTYKIITKIKSKIKKINIKNNKNIDLISEMNLGKTPHQKILYVFLWPIYQTHQMI